MQAIALHCSTYLAGIEGLVSLLMASRTVHDAYAATVYDAIDPGCVEALSAWEEKMTAIRRLAGQGQLMKAGGAASGCTDSMQRSSSSVHPGNSYWQQMRSIAATIVLPHWLPTPGPRTCAVRLNVRDLWQARRPIRIGRKIGQPRILDYEQSRALGLSNCPQIQRGQQPGCLQAATCHCFRALVAGWR